MHTNILYFLCKVQKVWWSSLVYQQTQVLPKIPHRTRLQKIKKRMYMYSGIQSLRPLVKILLLCICSECNTISFITNNLKNVHELQNILVFPPFTLMTSCTPAGMDSTSLLKTWWASLSQQDLTMFQRASCDVTESLAFSVFKCPHKCSMGLRSGDCGGKSMTVRTPWSSLVFSSSCKALRCVWGHYPAAVWLLLHRCKPEGITCLWRMEWYFSLVRIESIQCRPRPEYFLHHVSLSV